MKESKNKIRLNALDIAIILIVAAVIITAIIRSGLTGKLTFSGQSFSVVMHVDSPCADFSADLQGQRVYTGEGELFGKIVAASLQETEDGAEPVLILTAECSLMVRDSRYLSQDGTVVVRGKTLFLHTQTVSLTAVVDSVS